MHAKEPDQALAGRSLGDHAPTRDAAEAPRANAAQVAPPQPTRAFRDASTPGPNDPGQLTQREQIDLVNTSATSPLPPIPGYDVRGYLGRGGMGVVYRARHAATGRDVALKLIGPRGAGDDIARERFVREVHSLARLKHPNIVPVYDAGEWHGFPYCTMEFVPGGTLNDHLDRFRENPDRAVRLVAKVARAVEVLHAAGIIHRDLKPLNILLGTGDEPLVADFGLAKWLGTESDLTFSGLPVGTRQYMAPEQTIGRGRDYTPACDVWALGVTLYEILTGHRPFVEDGETHVYHSIRTLEPVPPSELRPEVPAELQSIVLKCLAKRPEDRYASAAELAEELERWLRHEPVLTPPLPVPAKPAAPANVAPATRERKGVRRIARIAVLLAFVTAVGLGASAMRPKKSVAERIEAGETVALTDDKGRPLFEPVDEPEHALLSDTLDGYHCFSRPGTGIANLLDVPLPHSYRVEAELGTTFSTYPGARAGIYVGRRVWGGLPIKHESLWAVDIGPDYVDQKRLLISRCEKYWWMRHETGGTSRHGQASKPWHPDNKDVKLRFAHVRIDVRGDSLNVTIDGHSFRTVSSDVVGWDLNFGVRGAKQDSGFPDYNCEPPYLGSGIGIFCRDNGCVVRNLTITKLPPTP